MTGDGPGRGPVGIARRARLVTDARGRRVTMVDPLVMRLSGDERVDPQTLERVARRVGLGIDVWPRRALAVGVTGIALAVAIFGVRYGLAYARTGVMPTAHLVGRLPVLIAVVTGLAFHWVLARQVRMRRVRDAMLEQRLCPHCAYDLRVQASPEGPSRAVCPECGCVWPIRAARDAP